MLASRKRWTFMEEYTVEQRAGLARRMRRRQPGSVPIVLARASSRSGEVSSGSGELRVNVPSNLTLAQLHHALRERLEAKPRDALVFFVDRNTLVTPSTTMAYLYLGHAHCDLFLYLTYCTENVFG